MKEVNLIKGSKGEWYLLEYLTIESHLQNTLTGATLPKEVEERE